MGQSGSTFSNTSKASNARSNPFLKKAKDQLYANRDETGDAIFIVQSDVIRAHRCVLAALSPKYNIQFYGAMPDTATIEVRNVSPGAFMEFLQFFYLDEVTLTMKNIESVLDLAQQSLVEDIVEECAKFLLDMVGIDKLTWCYRLAVLYQILRLQKFCEEQVSVHIINVFKTADFLECDRDILCRILKLNSLNCKEIEVFEACIAWARAACKTKSADVPKAANLREVLGDAVFQIRFCAMTVEEFASLHKLYAGFFSTNESNEIIYGIGKVNDANTCMFSNKPREPKTTASTLVQSNSESTLECVISGNKAKVNRPPNEVEKIAFICDKPIYLKGLVVRFEKLATDLSVDIDLGSKQLKRHPANVTMANDENRITFGEPVKMEAHERCLITLKSKMFKQGKKSGYCIKSEIVDNNGIWFQFLNSQYGDTTLTILITNLLYNPVGMS